jgi:hypothetical protein
LGALNLPLRIDSDHDVSTSAGLPARPGGHCAAARDAGDGFDAAYTEARIAEVRAMLAAYDRGEFGTARRSAPRTP